MIDNDLLLKPFVNNLKVHYCPINPTMTFPELSKIISNLQPKHIISPYTAVPPENDQEEIKLQDDVAERHLKLTHNCVVDTICKSQTVELSERELGSLNYRGKCPTSISALIKMEPTQGSRLISRVTDLQLEFKDAKYHITGVSVPKEELGRGTGVGAVG